MAKKLWNAPEGIRNLSDEELAKRDASLRREIDIRLYVRLIMFRS